MGIVEIVFVLLGASAGFLVWYKWAEERIYSLLSSRLDKESLPIDLLVQKYQIKVGLVTLLISICGIFISFNIGKLGYFFIPFFTVLTCIGIWAVWKK